MLAYCSSAPVSTSILPTPKILQTLRLDMQNISKRPVSPRSAHKHRNAALNDDSCNTPLLQRWLTDQFEEQRKPRKVKRYILKRNTSPPEKRIRINSANARQFSNGEHRSQKELPEVEDSMLYGLESDDDLQLPVYTIIVSYLLFLFALAPSRTLQLLLTIMIFFGSRDCSDILPWTITTTITALIMPMGVSAKLEVTMGLMVALWIKRWT
jgi:hypothetical protein